MNLVDFSKMEREGCRLSSYEKKLLTQRFSGEIDPVFTEASIGDKQGVISLEFVWISSSRREFRFVHAKAPLPCFATWKNIRNQLGDGQFFCILTRNKPAPTSSSGWTFDVLGMLCEFNSAEDLSTASHLYWDLTEHADSFKKMQIAVEFSNELKKCITNYNQDTHTLLEICSKGGLKDVLKYVKQETKNEKHSRNSY